MSFVARILLCAALAGAALSPASAHRGHDALSVVTIGSNGAVTVSHRFEASDVEPALAAIAPRAQPSLDDPDAVAALVTYLGTHFRLASERGPIVLRPGPVELGAAEVRLSFTGTVPRTAKRLTISSDLLGDMYPGQVNQVSVRVGTTTRTLAMAAGEVQTITLAPPAPRRAAHPPAKR
jgi:hypothetical protein